jgi:predicted Zn finger-like uncharacterized protein
MALATKCPHCNTTFRVAHDQLKLRGGIVRCGACNEVFDGNAALLEPVAKPQPTSLPATPTPTPLPLPEPTPFDEKMAALDTRAAEVLGSEPIYTLELDTALEAAEAAQAEPLPVDFAPEIASDIAPEPELEPEPEAEPEPEPALEAPLDLDLDLDVEPEQEPEPEPQAEAEPPLEDALTIETMSDEELEAALEAELAVMEQSIVPEREPETVEEPSPDFFAEMLAADDRREPTWDEPAADDPVADPVMEPTAEPQARPPRADELDEVDEEALVQLSTAGKAEAKAARPHVHLHATTEAEEAEEQNDTADEVEVEEDNDDEPGFVKRDRRRQKYGKATTIAMSLGSLLLVGALAAQGLTTFRNQIAAAMPPLKPALLAACNALGCKIELPAQIDDLSIEQGELQTLSDTTFSFTTLLRNQGATAQAWPHIELVLDDANDKRILRRVFTPRDYLGVDAPVDKGFAPHTEQSVKLYFELKELKASGYHIAVFYP